MTTRIKSVFEVNNKKTVLVSLLLVIVLFTSLFVYVLTRDKVDPAIEYEVHVNTEIELKTTINNATHNIPIVIVLNNDIILKEPLVIPANKNITLTSNLQSGFFKLIGADKRNTISVMDKGILTIDGIIVTHKNGNSGHGIYVNPVGIFVMYKGVITGNTEDQGGGVFNFGNFSMYGGEIYDNKCSYNGGGVDNNGNFDMFGGKIYKNKSAEPIDDGTFGDGGGVHNSGIFMLIDGEISDNFAKRAGGGVCNTDTFIMAGGKISDNRAGDKAGGVYSRSMFGTSSFTMYDGIISHNSANFGGGVCIDSKFDMFNGVISDNTANLNGGGVYIGYGSVNVAGGKISGNKAANNGGGVWVDTNNLVGLTVSDGVIFNDNWAHVTYSRLPAYDEVYNTNIGKSIVWTSPFTQGYNNYDIGIGSDN
jgi:hypothetical protein